MKRFDCITIVCIGMRDVPIRTGIGSRAATSHLHIGNLYGHVARLPAEDPAYRILYSRDPGGLDYAEGPSACFVVAPDGSLSEGYGHGGPVLPGR